jgi:hypothetical protein
MESPDLDETRALFLNAVRMRNEPGEDVHREGCPRPPPYFGQVFMPSTL